MRKYSISSFRLSNCQFSIPIFPFSTLSNSSCIWSLSSFSSLKSTRDRLQNIQQRLINKLRIRKREREKQSIIKLCWTSLSLYRIFYCINRERIFLTYTFSPPCFLPSRFFVSQTPSLPDLPSPFVTPFIYHIGRHACTICRFSGYPSRALDVDAPANACR